MQFSLSSSENIFKSNYRFLHAISRLRSITQSIYYRSKTTYKKLNIEISQNRDHKLSLRICRTTWTTTTTTNNNHNNRLIHNEKENKQEKTKHRTVKEPWRVCVRVNSLGKPCMEKQGANIYSTGYACHDRARYSSGRTRTED